MRILTLSLTLSMWTLCVAQGFGAGPGRFAFTPKIVAPGGSITISGSLFSGAAVGFSIVDSAGQRTVLGAASPSGGAFTQAFPIPASLPSGRYLMQSADASGQTAINLTGTLDVTPVASPWFQYQPTTVAPGNILTVSVTGFNPASPSAAVSLIDSSSHVTVLGLAPLTNGAFTQTFQVPATLPYNSSYQVVVRDSLQQFARNITGPLTLAFWSVKPTATVGAYPIGAAVNPFTNHIFVPNGADNTLSVLDGSTNAPLATVPVGNLPCAIGVNPISNLAYVANVNTNDVSVVDGATNTVVATVPAGSFPCAVGVIPWSNRVYVGNYGSNDVTVIDGSTNTVLTTIQVAGPPYGIGVNPGTDQVFVATGNQNLLTVINGATNSVAWQVPVGRGPDAIGVNTANNRIYVGNYLDDTVTVFDGNTLAVLATIPVGREPDGIAVNPFNGLAYVGNYASNTVTVLTNSNRVATTLAVGFTPDGVAVNPYTNTVYVPDSNTNSVSVIQNLLGLQSR